MTFAELLAARPRVAIGGAGDTGKTTLANQAHDRPVIHTDDWLTGDKETDRQMWPRVPALVRVECSKHAAFVVEGTRAVGVLRDGLQVDAMVWLRGAHVPQTPAQVTAAKGRETDFGKWRETATIPVYVLGSNGFELG